MIKPLAGTKVAVLVANGFEEKNFLLVQKMMLEMGASISLISTNQGLVNGWDGSNWGHNYAVDAPLNTALGADYDALILPGGERSMEKIKLTAHTRSFIGSFMSAEKPIAVMGDAVNLMAFTEQLADRTVTGPEDMRAACEEAGATWIEDSYCMDQNMLTGMANAEDIDAYSDVMSEMFMQNVELEQAA